MQVVNLNELRYSSLILMSVIILAISVHHMKKVYSDPRLKYSNLLICFFIIALAIAVAMLHRD